MNFSIQFVNSSSQPPGRRLLSNAITEAQPQPQRLYRRISPSRTPDRLFGNDYPLTKTPSIKGISERLAPAYPRQNMSIPPTTKTKAIDKTPIRNKLSNKRQINISNGSIVRPDLSKLDNSFSHPRAIKIIDKNQSRAIGASPGRNFRQLQPISNPHSQKLKLSDLNTGNLLKQDRFIRIPQQKNGVNSSFQHTRNNSLIQAHINVTSSPSDGLSTSFVTSIGSVGGVGLFLTEQDVEKDNARVQRSQNNPKVALRPLVESNIPTQKFMKLSQQPKHNLVGLIPSLNTQKFDGYRRARLKNEKYKDRNLSLNYNHRSYNLSNSRFKGN